MTTIAVLDSDKDVVFALTHRLKGAFTVIGTTETMAALDLIETGRAQILVTDILASGMDGLAIVLEARKRRPHIPVVVVSASADPGDPHGRSVLYRYTVPGSRWSSSSDREQLVDLLVARTGDGELPNLADLDLVPAGGG
jgi:CheY-like chemotaxis protein